ncbi:MAG: acyl-CoA dehydrogenase, partial [Nitriliruptorales bacterium]|nr:acyl-CoA dehydrogenase [Nitriliruptorales bacterium]
GAPAGTRGISLFAVPKRRPTGDGGLVDNDVDVTGMIHKIGWKGLPSLALSFGERGDCVGWLVGEPNRGLAHMFQMMNEARLMVGLNGVATAAVAYHESLAYARERPQGRPLEDRDPTSPPVPIIEHADVRRMLLRQKAIVDGGMTLVMTAAMQADLAAHGASEEERARAQRLLDLLTPIVKSFPAEAGFESNVLAVQIHGGYGYSSEYLPEAWLRDQKLNSIHEGTTGIQSIDLLGRRAMAGEGAAIATLVEAVADTIERARHAEVDDGLCASLEQAVEELAGLTAELGAIGAGGDVERMLRHSVDYLDLFSVVVVAWQHLLRAAAATESSSLDETFRDGVLRTTRYWFATELPRVTLLAERIRGGEDSFATMDPSSF